MEFWIAVLFNNSVKVYENNNNYILHNLSLVFINSFYSAHINSSL